VQQRGAVSGAKSARLRERHLKGRVIDLAQLAPGQQMLDLGCGTGTQC
jgi:ubiquinone/menaquinone biosynthesis C-methylase UbiE